MGQPMPSGIRSTGRTRPPEWAIPCPVPSCRARPGQRCTTPTGRPLAAGSHPSRFDAWLTQQAA